MGKIVNNGDGSALMKDPEKAGRIVEAVVKALPGVPVTAKFRRGWDHGSACNCRGVCSDCWSRRELPPWRSTAAPGPRCTAAPADWNCHPGGEGGGVHPRHRQRRRVLGRRTPWRILPLHRRGHGHDRPGLLRQSLDLSAGQGRAGGTVPCPPLPPLAERCETAVRQIRMAASYKGERVAVLEARKQYCWYLKGVPHANYYKEQIVQMNTLEDVDRITKGIQRDLRD